MNTGRIEKTCRRVKNIVRRLQGRNGTEDRLGKLFNWGEYWDRKLHKAIAAGEETVVVPVAGARVCMDCDVVYSAPHSCPRCHGDSYMELGTVLPMMFKIGEKRETVRVVKSVNGIGKREESGQKGLDI
jgi:hypothetical protein